MSDEKGRPRQLGRGLEALFGEDRTNLAAAEPAPVSPAPPADRPQAAPAAAPGHGLRIVPIGKLIPNPLQPRRHFDDAALKDLTASIREQGILQPLIVRPTRSNDDTFEIVAGERRWRAAQRAQVHEAPVIVRDFTDEEALAVALIENIQRDELSPLEEAEAFARLSRDFDKTQEQVAEVVGKSRSHVANMMRLLDLPQDVREMLADGRLTAGHARAILRSPDPTALALEIVSEGLSVREAERLGKASRGKGPAKSRVGGTATPLRGKDADTLALERKLSNGLGAKVEISFDGTGGFVKVQYRSLEQFEDLVERLMGNGPKIAGDNFEFGGLPSDDDEEEAEAEGISGQTSAT
ncbi:MAG: ParB/RepB/Spo0J family partition protein [Alphaproteobacteria bacterium]